jgi:hypothetical protein
MKCLAGHKMNIQQRVEARKAIASYRILLKRTTDLQERLELINKIAEKEAFLATAEVGAELPGAPQQDSNKQPQRLPTLADLWNVLEKNLHIEEQQISVDPAPSQTALERWALRAAVLDYYKSLQMDPNTQVVEGYGNDRAISQLAPDKDVIYNIWLQKLYDLNRRRSKYHVRDDTYKVDTERGIPQGGAFEKQLDRYRDDFMNQLWLK